MKPSAHQSRLAERIGEKSALFREEMPAARRDRFRAAVRGGTCAPAGAFPPTLFTIFRKGEFELFERFGIVLASVLHAEQEYTYHDASALDAGAFAYRTELTQALEKRGSQGSLQFITLETTIQAERGPDAASPVVTARTLVVVRAPAEGGAA